MSEKRISTGGLEAINGRRSIRAYQNKPVPKELIELLIKAAAMAPSVLNSQPWRFTVVQGAKKDELLTIVRRSPIYLEDTLAQFNEAERAPIDKLLNEEKERVLKFYESLGGAPVIVVLTMKKTPQDVNRRMALMACGAAAENFMLAANCYGLGTCCVGTTLWLEEELLELVGIANSELVTIISLGYPAHEGKAPVRKKNITDWVGF